MERNKMKRVLASILMLSFCSVPGSVLAAPADSHIVVGSQSDSIRVDGATGISHDGYYGGVVDNYAGGEVTLSGTFEGNSNNALSYGGSVVYSHNKGSIIVENSTQFINNQLNVPEGGVSAGGVIAAWGGTKLQIGDDVVFRGNGNGADGNPASAYGGAIYADYYLNPDGTVAQGQVIIGENVLFENNASTYAGAIYMDNVKDSSIGAGTQFIGNEASENFAGAILVNGTDNLTGSNLTIEENVVFQDNYAATDGGAIYNWGHVSETIKEGASFTKNEAGTYGGAIYNEALVVQGDDYMSSVDIDGVTFDNNTAGVSGGAIYNIVSPYDEYSTVTDADKANGSVSADNTLFTGNSAVEYGGAIYNEANASIGTGSSFEFNKVYSDENANLGRGGAIANLGGELVVADATTDADGVQFIGNEAGYSGGAIINEGGTATIGSGTKFTQNTAANGGAISSTKVNGEAAVTNIGNSVVFSENSAEYAGAILNQQSNMTIGNKVVFSGNKTTDGSGGAIANESYADSNSSLIIGESAQFINNESAKSGGAVYSYNNSPVNGTNTVTVQIGDGAFFEGNSAKANGGAVASYAAGAVIGENTVFNENHAASGGAIYHSAYGNEFDDGAVLTVNGGASFDGNYAESGNGGAIYTAGETILDTTAGDMNFTNNTANGAANDIYLDNDSVSGTISAALDLKGTNEVSIGSGIAGVANTTITNSGTTLSLESGSVNKDYAGSYTQESGTTNVSSNFFGGESTIKNGGFNLNDGAELVEGSKVTTESGVTTVIAEAANVTINGSFENNGTTTVASSANLVINGEYTSENLENKGNITASNTTIAVGNYSQTDDNASLTIDNSVLDVLNGNMTIESGTLTLLGAKAGIAENDIVTITDNVDLVIKYGETATIDSDGLEVGLGHIAINGDVNNFYMNDTDVIVAGNVLTQNVTVIDADISGSDKNTPLTIGTDAKDVDLILSNNATSSSGFIVSEGSNLQLTPNDGSSLTLTENNAVSGAGSVLVDEIVETVENDDGTTSEIHHGVGTVYIQSDNSGFTGEYTQNMGTVIAQAGSVFFNGDNTINKGTLTIEKDAVLGGNSNTLHGGTINIQEGAVLSGATNTVDGGVLNLADGAILDSDVSVLTNANGGYGTVNIYNPLSGQEGTEEFEGKTVLDAQTAITNGALTYLNGNGSTQNITITGGGLGLFNDTIITGETPDNTVSLVAGSGVSHLTVGDGSGLYADNINLGDNTSLTYKDNAYIKQESTVTLDGNASLNFRNENTDIEYNPSIISSSADASINKSGAGSTSIESSLTAYNGSINVTGGALDLAGDDQSAILNLSGISVDNSSLTADAHILVNGGGEKGIVSVNNGGTLSVNNSLEAENLIEVNDSTLNVLGSLASGTETSTNSAINFNSAIVNVGEDIVTDNIGIHNGSVVEVGGALDSKLFEASGEGTVVNIAEGLIASNTTTDNASLGVKDGAVVSIGEDVTAAGNISVVNGSSLTSGGSVTAMTGTVDVESSTLNILGDLIAENSTNGTSLGITNGSDVSVTGSVSANQNVAVDNSNLTVLGDLAATEGLIGVSNNSNLAVDGDVTFDSYFVVNGDSSAEVNGNLTGNGGMSIAGEKSKVTLNGDTAALGGNLNLRDGVLNNFTNMSVAGDMLIANTAGVTSTPVINMQDGGVSIIDVAGSLTQSSDVNMAFDYDPRGNAMDQIVVGSDVNVGDNQILITGINFINTPDDYNFTIDGSKLITGTDGHGYANIGDSQFVANTALGQYLITSTSGGAGAINGTLQSVNPQMYRGQVATVAQYANQLAFNNIMFDHAAIVSGQLGPNSDDEIANRYAATNPLFGPYQYSKKDGGLWFKAYGNIENISMTKGIHVDNQAYGAILGADLPVVKLKDGWKLIPSAYVAYNGGHQNYDFVSMYQNGGQIGAMATAYKGNFFTSLLAYGGGYANEMNVRNMGYGATGLADNTGNWFAGVASKSAYNFHLPKNFIIQPTAMVAYNIFGNQNYGSTFGGNLSMNSGFLNGINVAPGVNVIWNKKTFSIYGTAQMVFNIMGGVDGQAGKVTLDDVRMKHPYFEYGLGVVKSFKERLSGYFQFTIRNGGRTGIGFMGGFQCKLGK